MKTEILQYLHYNPLSKRADILPSLSKQVSDRTLMRMLSDAVSSGRVEVVGRGPSTRYKLTPQAHVTMELNLDTYFDKEIDERQVHHTGPQGQCIFYGDGKRFFRGAGHQCGLHPHLHTLQQGYGKALAF